MGKAQTTVDKDKLMTVMEREFDAPLEKLWDAHADAAKIAQWWGPRSLTTTVDKMEFRTGGSWRFIHHDDKGTEYGFHGEFKDIVEHERITWTFEFEGMPGHVITETIHFEDLGGGKSKLRTESQYASLEDLDGMIDSGMEDGANESWDRLEELARR